MNEFEYKAKRNELIYWSFFWFLFIGGCTAVEIWGK
jgi:hypothetical protein